MGIIKKNFLHVETRLTKARTVPRTEETEPRLHVTIHKVHKIVIEIYSIVFLSYKLNIGMIFSVFFKSEQLYWERKKL